MSLFHNHEHEAIDITAKENSDKDAEVQLSTADGFWQGCGWGKSQLSLHDGPLGVQPCFSEHMGNKNRTPIFVVGGSPKGQGADMERLGSDCALGVHEVTFPNNQ